MFSHPIFTQVKIGSSVFSQGIIQSDTLKGSGGDARVMPRGICDTHPTLVYTHKRHKNHITKVHTQDTKSNVHHVINKINTKHIMAKHSSF
jgi:hypothetical protein